MPRVTVAPHIPALAADFNQVADQAVMTFPTAAARTAAVPTPTAGMVTYLSDTKQLQSWDGASWTTWQLQTRGGFATPSPSGGGFANIAHGLGRVPTWATVAVGRSGAQPTAVDKIAELYITAVDATNIAITVLRKDTQAGQDGSPVGVCWAAG